MKEVLIVFVIAIGALILSWGITVGVALLISKCFGLHISLLIATGIWLCFLLIKWAFGQIRKG